MPSKGKGGRCGLCIMGSLGMLRLFTRTIAIQYLASVPMPMPKKSGQLSGGLYVSCIRVARLVRRELN